MNIRSVAANGLTSDEIAAWSAIQRDHPRVDSPYFHPEFTRAVASVRKGVEVAIFEDAGRTVGFFAYQRTRWNTGRPVAQQLSDFQAVIASEEMACDPLELLRACQLSTWHFDHLLSDQVSFAPFMWRVADSPYIDLACGFETYQTERRQAGCGTMANAARKLRKLQREVGPVRFEMMTTDEHVLQTLIRWKSEQYRESKSVDVFAFGWPKQLLRLLLDRTDLGLCGVMSACYVKDELAAIHYGMRSNHVLHSWFPAYRKDLGKYSPGSQLLIEIIKSARGLGIERIDLGKGAERYKRSFMNGATLASEGTVDVRPSAVMVRGVLRRMRDGIRSSPLSGPARVPARILHRVRSWLELR